MGRTEGTVAATAARGSTLGQRAGSAPEVAPTTGEEPSCRPGEHVPRAATPHDYDLAAQLFRALGDSGRLRVLDYLRAGEACVSELAELTGDPLPAISQRLRLLRQDRLVSRRREGRHVYYQLADDHVRELIDNALAHASEHQS